MKSTEALERKCAEFGMQRFEHETDQQLQSRLSAFLARRKATKELSSPWRQNQEKKR